MTAHQEAFLYGLVIRMFISLVMIFVGIQFGKIARSGVLTPGGKAFVLTAKWLLIVFGGVLLSAVLIAGL